MNLKKIIFYLVLVSLVILPLEFLSYYVCSNIFAPRGLVFIEQDVTVAEYEDYIKTRDPILGWTCAKIQCKELDAIGSREIPSFKDPYKYEACVSAYGDSYTFSNRTKAKDSWCNKLSVLIDCRVNNFGVSGYGTDQAYMRYLNNVEDSAHFVLLNHFVFDIMRNVNQHWGTRFSVPGQRFGFKPRFILKDDHLELAPLPKPSYEELRILLKEPNKFLKNEYYLPDSIYGSPIMHFPYTVSMIKTILFHSKFKSLFNKEPVHMPFYKSDHPSGSLELTYSIMNSFKVLAAERKQIPIVHIIPFSEDIDYYLEHGTWPYNDLLKKLDSSNIFYINSGQEIVDRNIENYITLYAGEGHFNAKGDSVLAEIISVHIKKLN